MPEVRQEPIPLGCRQVVSSPIERAVQPFQAWKLGAQPGKESIASRGSQEERTGNDVVSARIPRRGKEGCQRIFVVIDSRHQGHAEDGCRNAGSRECSQRSQAGLRAGGPLLDPPCQSGIERGYGHLNGDRVHSIQSRQQIEISEDERRFRRDREFQAFDRGEDFK